MRKPENYENALRLIVEGIHDFDKITQLMYELREAKYYDLAEGLGYVSWGHTPECARRSVESGDSGCTCAPGEGYCGEKIPKLWAPRRTEDA